MTHVVTESITQELYLPPKCFDRNIVSHLLSTVMQKYNGKCIQEIGLIEDIVKITKIENKISKSSQYAEFQVTFDARVTKPTVDQVVSFTIDQIQVAGVFGAVSKVLRMFIPTSMLEEWVLEKDDSNAERNRLVRPDGKSLYVGQVISARIKHVKFIADRASGIDRFGCVCEFVE
jgi:DNA-directed RNA polymerase subunit E'/Rpb7